MKYMVGLVGLNVLVGAAFAAGVVFGGAVRKYVAK